MNNIFIIGNGGHAKVVIDCIEQENKYTILNICDADKNKIGSKILGYDILSEDDIPSICANTFIVAIGDNIIRLKMYDKFSHLGFAPVSIIHPTAYFSPHASIGIGSIIMRGATVHPNAKIGNNVIINTMAIIEHDVIISDHCQISPNATICGVCCIGERTSIGAGAVIKQCIKIGNNCTVGAGAVVINDVIDNTTVVGVPAKQVD